MLNHPKPKAVAEDKTIQTQTEKKAASTPKKRKGAGEMKTWTGLIRLPSQVDRNGHGVVNVCQRPNIQSVYSVYSFSGLL